MKAAVPLVGQKTWLDPQKWVSNLCFRGKELQLCLGSFRMVGLFSESSSNVGYRKWFFLISPKTTSWCRVISGFWHIQPWLRWHYIQVLRSSYYLVDTFQISGLLTKIHAAFLCFVPALLINCVLTFNSDPHGENRSQSITAGFRSSVVLCCRLKRSLWDANTLPFVSQIWEF